ncbi:hypothetical protein MHW47_06080 [Streptomyces sp. OfavH-34-F]|uniref:hypothetical protein n=1 Tax=Streptomyces sp. OfavH-34-F TaxID=2917760 RepID=UPI001EF3D27F|nr:hypothetical protein [Streptomyces sp. OfavH-34-F]MCG7524010.1 hypothetical protein [Streptomyces sp. OfavH-34-F]
MLPPDLARLVLAADRSRLVAAVQAAADVVAWYAPPPKPDYADTRLSIARSEAKAELAEEVVDAIVLTLSACTMAAPAANATNPPDSPNSATEQQP